jgi:hypothetical protein
MANANRGRPLVFKAKKRKIRRRKTKKDEFTEAQLEYMRYVDCNY